MKHKTTLLALALLAAAPLAAQDDIFIYVGYAGTPPTNSVPITRILDVDGSGIMEPSRELFAFQRKFFSVKTGYSFLTDLTYTVENGRVVFFATDSGGSSKGECFLVRSVDSNGDGVIQDKETKVWADFGKPTTYGYSPDSAAVLKDANGNSVVYTAHDASGLAGIWRSVDLNGDGDALDPGETKVWANKASALKVPVTGGTLTLNLDEVNVVRPDPKGGLLAWSSAYYKSLQNDSFVWLGFRENQGKIAPRNFFNPSGLNKLDRNVDFASGAIVDIDITWVSGSTTYHFNDLHLLTVVPNGFGGKDVYYFATGYGAKRTFGDKNKAGQKVSGLVFRAMDLNGDGDLNDKGEVNLFYNGSGAPLPGGQLVKTVKPASYYDHLQQTNVTVCDWIEGISAVGDTIYLIHDQNGGGQDAVLMLKDKNHNFRIDTGEVTEIFWVPKPYPAVYSSQYGPYVNGILALPKGLIPEPQPKGVQPYGMGCPGSNSLWPLAWSHGGAPAPGNSKFQARISRGLPSSTALFLLGYSKTNFAGLGKLPFPLDFLGMKGCFLNTNIIMGSAAALDTTGQGSAPLPIPNNPALRGASLFGQFLVVDPKANPGGLTSTDGLQVTIQ